MLPHVHVRFTDFRILTENTYLGGGRVSHSHPTRGQAETGSGEEGGLLRSEQ